MNDTRAAIQQRFSTQWAAGSYPNVPVLYDNVPASIDNAQPSVKLSILPETGTQRELGKPAQAFRYLGTIEVAIGVPENEGSAEANLLAEEALSIFRSAQFSYANSGQITCRTESVQPLGVVENRFLIVCRTEYYRDASYS